MGTVVANNWRAVGVDTSVEVLPSELTRDLAVRASYTCVETSSRALGRMSFQQLESNNAMLPENNYSGTDHGSYMNPQLDVALNGLFAALTVDDRLQREREALQIITTDVPLIPTYINTNTYYEKHGVSGVLPKSGLDLMNSETWNVNEWDKE